MYYDGSMNNAQNHGVPFSVTASGTTTASATTAGIVGRTYYVTDISVSSSGTSGTWVLYAGSDAVYQGAGSARIDLTQYIPMGSGNGITLTANGTTATFANVGGFYIPTV